MGEISGSQLVAKALKQQGVECIFTLSDLPIVPIYQPCVDEGIRVIDVRHEQSAAHAAEGWSKVTGKPGVALVGHGPALTNTTTAVANAFLSATPMVIIAGRSAWKDSGRGAMGELAGVDLMRSITKWSQAVVETRRIPDALSTAFRQTITGKYAPVLVEIPTDVLEGRVDEAQVNFPSPQPVKGGQGDPELIKEAARLITKAETVAVISGNSVRWCEASESLRQFIERANVPVFLQGLARGAIAPDHFLYFSRIRRQAFSEAEVIVVVGAPLDFRLGYGQPPTFPEGVKVIQIDVAVEEIGRNRAVDVGLLGDVNSILLQLTEELEKNAPLQKRSQWIEKLRGDEEAIKVPLAPSYTSDAVPIHPARLCAEIRDFLDQDAIVVGDGGDIVTFGAMILNIYKAGHWLDPGNMGCLGIGPGYAMAAKVAHPQNQVLLLSGDGSFGFNGMEFDTMVRHKLPVVAVVGNDSAWGMVKHGVRRNYDQEEVLGVELSAGTRYDKLVNDLGGYGELVERPEDIRPALTRAFASGLPACINVITDPNVAFGRTGRRAE